MSKQIFISYRRQGARAQARAIKERLENHGYTVFLDIDSMPSGKYMPHIEKAIQNCTDFLLLLPKGSLLRCCDKDDVLRKEIECALESNKNIIPIMLEKFEFPKELPESIKSIPEFTGVKLENMDQFNGAMLQLYDLLQSKSNNGELQIRGKGYAWLWGIVIAILLFAGVGFETYLLNTVKVPDTGIVGLKYKDAAEMLEQLGFVASESAIEYSETEAMGTVTRVENQGKRMPRGATIICYTSLGKIVRVPYVVGQTQEKGTARLKELNLKVKIDKEYSEDKMGTIIKQNIQAETMISESTEITLTISAGKEPIEIETESGVDEETVETTAESVAETISESKKSTKAETKKTPETKKTQDNNSNTQPTKNETEYSYSSTDPNHDEIE